MGSNPPSVSGGIRLSVLPPGGPGQPIPVFGLAPGRGPFHQILEQRHPQGIILAPGCVVSAPPVGALAPAFTPLAQERGGYFLGSIKEPLAALPLLAHII